jgi:DNA polymerase-4
MRRILHIDMDAFYAAVEERRLPHLSGKPVVVGGSGDPTQRGVVATANYESRKYGIHSAMPLQTAHRLCPHAVFLPVDYAEYSRISKIIKTILKTYSPVMQDVGIDEAYLDITESHLPSDEIAGRIKADIRKATSLTCSIGIAPNKLVAKIASDLDKPDGLTIVAEQDVEGVLGPLPVRKLHGVGPKTEARLLGLGVETVGQLRALPRNDLIACFGASHGVYLFEASRGIDPRPLVTSWKRKSIGRERTFQRDLHDWQDVARNLAGLSKKVVQDMNSRGLKGRTVGIKIRFSDFTTLTRSHTLPKSLDSLEEIRRAAFENLSRIELKGKRVRLIGVRVEGLE